jgi:hypothetical protein
MEGGVLGQNEVGDYVRVVDAQHTLQQLGGDRGFEQALTAILLCKAEMEVAVVHYWQSGVCDVKVADTLRGKQRTIL